MHCLIDGHNLIGQMPGLHLADPDDEDKLLEYLRRYRARTGHKLWVAFDSGPGHPLGSHRKRGGITVQFARQGQTADRLLLKRIRRVKNPQGAMVVSSDRAIQQAAERAGRRVVPAGEFGQRLLDLATGPGPATEEDSQAHVHLSEEEVEAWLEFFQRGRSDR